MLLQLEHHPVWRAYGTCLLSVCTDHDIVSI